MYFCLGVNKVLVLVLVLVGGDANIMTATRTARTTRHIERSLAEVSLIECSQVNCVYLLIFQAYHVCVTTCSLELPKGRSYNIPVFLTTCVSVYLVLS